MPSEWDTWAFQEMLLRQIENKTRYRGEHADRISRRQSNGNSHMRDSLTGEIVALEALLGGANYPTASAMIEQIRILEASNPPVKNDIEHQDAYQRGWSAGLREILAAAQRHSIGTEN